MGNVLMDVDAWVIAGLLAVAMVTAWAASWWRGGLFHKGGRDSPPTKFTDATLAIFGLLLAFTFSMSLTKHEQRRTQVVADRNAIASFLGCVSFLKEPLRGKSQALVRRYLVHRISLAAPSLSEAGLKQEFEAIRGMHREFESLANEAVAGGTPVVVPLVNGLNGLNASHATRQFAARDRLPPSIVLLLTLSAVIVMVQVGYQQGLTGEWRPGVTAGFIVLVCMVVWVILDLNQPQRGLITVSQEPLQELLMGMGP